jgi:dienelactone hydrolase
MAVDVALVVGALLATAIVSAASYRFFEAPMLRYKDRFFGAPTERVLAPPPAHVDPPLSAVRFFALFLLPSVAVAGMGMVLRATLPSAPATYTFAREELTFASRLDGTAPIHATVFVPHGVPHPPLLLLEHGYYGNRFNVSFSAQRFAERGFVALTVDPRGWADSAGAHDDGGLEVMDLYDAIDVAAARYGVDPGRVSMIGYSNGGGSAFLAMVRMPLLFQGVMPVFGIPDYGEWIRDNPSFYEPVTHAVGATPEEAPGKYLARSATAAVANLRDVRVHLAWDEQETTCPIAMDRRFIAAAAAAGFTGITVHESHVGDAHRWLHQYNDGFHGGHLSPLEDAFADDLLHAPPRAPGPPEGELMVPGFVVLPSAVVVLGSGEDGVGRVTWRTSGGETHLRVTSSDGAAPDAKVRVRPVSPAGAWSASDGTSSVELSPGSWFTSAAGRDIVLAPQPSITP